MDIWMIRKDIQRERDGKFSRCHTEFAVAATHEDAIKKMHDDADFYLTDTMFKGCEVDKDTDYMMKLNAFRNCGKGSMRVTYNIYHRSTDEGNLFV